VNTGLRSYIAGMHHPIFHSAAVTIGWIKLYSQLPSIKEFLCIIFHDIGYIAQKYVDGPDDRHPELGARMCSIFGTQYYILCATHSRDYSRKLKLHVSKLCYADKYALLVYPNWFHWLLIHFGGEVYEYYSKVEGNKWGCPVDIRLLKADYNSWVLDHLSEARAL